MKQHHHILVVDDDARLRALLAQYLEGEGFAVTTAEDARAAQEALRATPCDLAVVDVMMPGDTGITLTKHWRATGENIPVIMLTAMGEPQDRIDGLLSGADDYLAKPFEPEELKLRIASVLRRTAPQKTPHITFGPFTYDLETRELHRGKERIVLTSSEVRLFTIFAERTGEEISREELSQALNGISERSIDVQITRLRRKIEADPKQPIYLKTARGAGYIFTANRG